jgi:uncharacterized integral membrane protein
MMKAKLILALAMVALCLVLIFQNMQQVETKILFITVTMPRAGLLAITMLIGVAVGILIALWLARRQSGQD